MSAADRTICLDEGELRLKLATKVTVKALHTTALAADAAGTRQQRISDCQVPNTREFLRIDEVLRLEEAAMGSRDWPAITRAQARHHGFALLPLPDSRWAVGTSEWHTTIAQVSRESGEAVARACKIVADGEISADEVRAEQLIEEVDQAIASLAQLRALCAAAGCV